MHGTIKNIPGPLANIKKHNLKSENNVELVELFRIFTSAW